jgi:hypothetical protein
VLVTDERLREIIAQSHPNDTAWFREHSAMATELLAHRERNRRLATAVLSGNHGAVYKEYARNWLPPLENS